MVFHTNKQGLERKKKAELTEYKMASKLMSKRSFHLEKSRSATTATMNDCTVLNRHCVTVTTILSGQSFSKAGCTVNRTDTDSTIIAMDARTAAQNLEKAHRPWFLVKKNT